MEITEVRVFPARKLDDKLKAFATVTFDNCFVVRDLKVINGSKGMFVAMPSRKRNDGTYCDVAHPLDSKTRNYIEKTILREYEKVAQEKVGAQVYDDTEPSYDDYSQEETA